MPSTFLCPGCGHSVNSWATVGEKVICPGCGKSLGLILPAEPAPVRPAVPGGVAGAPDDIVEFGTYAAPVLVAPGRSATLRRHQVAHPWVPAVAILAAALLVFGVIVTAMISHSSAKSNPTEADAAWDVTHRPDIRLIKSDAESKALAGDLRGSYDRYQELEKLIGSNPVTDPETADLVRSAKTGEERVYQLLLADKSAGHDNTADGSVTGSHVGTPSNDVQLPSVVSSNLPEDPVRSAVSSASQETGQPAGTDPAARPVGIAPAPVLQPPPGGLQGNPTVPQAVALPGHLADQRIGQSLDAGINYLISRFNNGQIVDGRGADDVRHQGLDALCVYALLHASQGSSDPRLNIHGPFMVQLLTTLKAFPMAGRDPLKPMAPAVYAHSLRAAALAVYNRTEDHKQLQEDVNWLVNASMGGAYTYDDRYAGKSPGSSQYQGGSGSALPISPAAPAVTPAATPSIDPGPAATPVASYVPSAAPGVASNDPPVPRSGGSSSSSLQPPNVPVQPSVTTAGGSPAVTLLPGGSQNYVPSPYGGPSNPVNMPGTLTVVSGGSTPGTSGSATAIAIAQSNSQGVPPVVPSNGSNPLTSTSAVVPTSSSASHTPVAPTGSSSGSQIPLPSPVYQSGGGGGGGGGGGTINTGGGGSVVHEGGGGSNSVVHEGSGGGGVGVGTGGGTLVQTDPGLERTMPGPMVRTMPTLERTMPGPLIRTMPSLERTMPGPLVPTEPSLARTMPGPLVPTEPSLARTMPGPLARTGPGQHSAGGGRVVIATHGVSGGRPGSPSSGQSANFVPPTTAFGIPVSVPGQAPADAPASTPIPLQSDSVPASIPDSVPVSTPTQAVPVTPQVAPDSSGMLIVPQSAAQNNLTGDGTAVGDGTATPLATADGQTPDPATTSNLADLPQPTASQPLSAPGGVTVYQPRPRTQVRRPVIASRGPTPATPGTGATSSVPWYLVQVQENAVRNANGTVTEVGSVSVNGKVVETQSGHQASGTIDVPISTPHGGAVAKETWIAGPFGQPVVSVSVVRNPGAWGTPPPPVSEQTYNALQKSGAPPTAYMASDRSSQPGQGSSVLNATGSAPAYVVPSQTPVSTGQSPAPIGLQSGQSATPPAPAGQPAAGPAAGPQNGAAPARQPAVAPQAGANNGCSLTIVESKTKGADGVTVQTGTVTVNGVVVQTQSNSDPTGSVTVQFQTPYGVATAVEIWSNPATGPGVGASVTPPAGAMFQVPAGTSMGPGQVIGRIVPAAAGAAGNAAKLPVVAPPEVKTNLTGSTGGISYTSSPVPTIPDSSVTSFLPDSPVPQPTIPTPGSYTNTPNVVIVPTGGSSGPRGGPAHSSGGGPGVFVSARSGPNSSGHPVTTTVIGTTGGHGQSTESSTVSYNGHVIEHQSGNAPSGSESVPVQTSHGVVVATGSWSTGPGGNPGGNNSGSGSPAVPSNPAPNRGPAGPHPAGYIPATPTNNGPQSVWYGNQSNPSAGAPVVPAAPVIDSSTPIPSSGSTGNLIAARPNNPPPSPFSNNNNSRNNSNLTPQQPTDPTAILNDPTLLRQLTQQMQNSQGLWDNSNSQYGLLGVWSGAEAGCEVPNNYWPAVEKHWTSCELPTGQWCYSAFDPDPTLSMSCAGTASLLVCHEWMDWPAAGTRVGRQPYSPSLAQGLKYLETGNNITNIVTPDLKYLGYTAYGIERTALASGFKYFGTHDWYSELAAQLMPYQFPTGAWGNASDGTDSATVNTAYMVLFLSRGRHPILMNKLRFEPFWDNRPKDVANLAKYAGIELERPFNWQVVSADRPWSDWTDSPVLYIASHRPPTLSDADCQKLKSFAEAGGMIFTHSDSNSSGFNGWVEQLQKRLWPQYDLKTIPRDSAVYSSNYHLGSDKKVPNLKGIFNGSRYLLIHCPTDSLSAPWQDAATSQKVEFQMGINLFVYAAGHASFRNRLDSPFIPEPTVPAAASIKVARLKYDGNWDPEPYAWTRFGRYMQWTVGTAVDTVPIDLANLKPADAPVAVLTGNAAVVFSDAQVAAVKAYVQAGGTLLVDSTGGNTDFAKSAADLIARALPETPLAEVPATDPLVAGGTVVLDNLTKPIGRAYNTEAQIRTTPVQIAHVGQGRVIFTPVDLTTGLLGTNTWGIAGYDPEYAQKLVKNAVETSGTLN